MDDNKKETFLMLVNTTQEIANSNTTQQLLDVHRQSVELREKTKQIDALSKVQIAKIAAKYRLAETALCNIFSERDKALDKQYKLLDKAIEKDDNELVIAALKGISGIVSSSPLSDFEKMLAIYDDTNIPLLDF